MTPEQFELIVGERFARLNTATVVACRSVILEGESAYSAEDRFKCSRGTVNRYVNKINAELAFCEEVANHAKS
jgi:hypothetical protein